MTHPNITRIWFVYHSPTYHHVFSRRAEWDPRSANPPLLRSVPVARVLCPLASQICSLELRHVQCPHAIALRLRRSARAGCRRTCCTWRSSCHCILTSDGGSFAAQWRAQVLNYGYSKSEKNLMHITRLVTILSHVSLKKHSYSSIVGAYMLL
jgi:hypothetical protein